MCEISLEVLEGITELDVEEMLSELFHHWEVLQSLKFKCFGSGNFIVEGIPLGVWNFNTDGSVSCISNNLHVFVFEIWSFGVLLKCLCGSINLDKMSLVFGHNLLGIIIPF